MVTEFSLPGFQAFDVIGITETWLSEIDDLSSFINLPVLWRHFSLHPVKSEIHQAIRL